MIAARRTALIAPFRVPAPLETLRLREVASGRAGAPAHVTLLFPFAPPERLDDALLSRVAEVVASVAAFDVAFRAARLWEPGGGSPEGVVWLDPEPAAPFVALTEALERAFPGYPPYGGLHETIIPHLTLASDDRRTLRAVQHAASSELPFRRRASRASLIVEGMDGRWRTRRRFPLGRP